MLFFSLIHIGSSTCKYIKQFFTLATKYGQLCTLLHIWTVMSVATYEQFFTLLNMDSFVSCYHMGSFDRCYIRTVFDRDYIWTVFERFYYAMDSFAHYCDEQICTIYIWTGLHATACEQFCTLMHRGERERREREREREEREREREREREERERVLTLYCLGRAKVHELPKKFDLKIRRDPQKMFL